MYRARRSLPTPLSPVMRTFALVAADARATRIVSIIAGLAQRMSPGQNDDDLELTITDSAAR
jgi:hypothetical protein